MSIYRTKQITAKAKKTEDNMWCVFVGGNLMVFTQEQFKKLFEKAS